MKKGIRTFAWTMILTLLLWTLSPAVSVFALDRPTITVSTPTNNMVTGTPTVDIQGYVTDAVTLDINNERISFAQDGFFTYNLGLNPGDNSITIEAANSLGVTRVDLNVRYDVSAVSPSVVVTNYTSGQSVSTQNVTLMCTVSNNTGFSYSVNGAAPAPVPGAINGTYPTPVITLSPGDNTIILSVVNNDRVVNQPFYLKYVSGSPQVSNISPLDGYKVSTKTVSYTGVVAGVTQLEVFVNGSSAGYAAISNGNFLKENISLNPGYNTVSFVPDGSAAATQTVHISYEASPLVIITSPQNKYIADRDYVYIIGKVQNTETNGLTINDEHVEFGPNGAFSHKVHLDRIVNPVRVKAANGSLVSTADLMVYYSGIPHIDITSHTSGTTVNSADVVFSGTIFPTDHITGFTINGDDNLSRISNGSFTSKPVTLEAGSNEIDFVLTTDSVVVNTAAGNVTLQSRTVTRTFKINSNVGPQITVSSPRDGVTVYSNTVVVEGELARADLNTVKVGGTETKVRSDGSFSQTVTLKSGKNEIKIEAKLGDLTTTKIVVIYYDSIAAEDAVVRTKMTDGGEAKAFNDLVKVKLSKGSVGINTTSVLAVIDPDDCNDIPIQSSLIGPLISVGWNGEKPINTYKITLKYDEIVSDNQAHKISILHYHVGSEKWTMLSGVVDTKSKTVSVQTDRTGYFAPAIYFKTFDDLAHHWGERDIEYLVARGAIPIDTTHQFYPDRYITRAEFVMFLVKALGIQPYHQPISSYDDVDHNSDYYDYIEAALRAGLVFGVSHDRFAPNQNLTREEAAAILSRAGNMKALKDPDIIKLLSKFTDQETISPWARNQLAAAVKSKVLFGLADNTFNPKGKCTRAEAAAMLVRLSEILNKSKK